MKPMILSPVSDMTMLTAAIDAGCNGVYLGIKDLNMRATARNFELSQLRSIVELCHKNDVKVFLTVNSIIYDSEHDKVEKILKAAKDAGVDSIICWDMSVLVKAKELGLDVTLSTQASVSNSIACQFYENLGVSTVTLARECTLDQIKIIKKDCNVKIECFVHGAMCVAVSGRCFTSQFMFGKSANRGDCLQPCRRQYEVKDKETGDELELGNDFIMSPKDLCTIPIIEKIIDAGVDILKIEGRARSPEYVSIVTKCYREAVDAHSENRLTDELKKELMERLATVYNRGFSSGFYMGVPLDNWTDSYGSKSTERKTFVGKVKNFYKKIKVAEILIQSHGLKVGDQMMIQGPTTGVVSQEIQSMQFNGKEVKSSKKGDRVGVKLEKESRPNDKVFVVS